MTTATTRFKHVDHPDDERFDDVTITVHERWKESELSGDEWRFSYVVEAWRKGEVVIRKSFSRLDWAVGSLWSTLHLWPADGGKGFDSEAWDRTKNKCDQPGCGAEAVIFYERLKRYTSTGEELVGQDWATEYRQFCERHKHRGDCGLDDADDNYQQIPKPVVAS